MELQSSFVRGGRAVQEDVSDFRLAVAIVALLMALAGAAAASLAAVQLGFADLSALLSSTLTVEKAIFGGTVMAGAAVLLAMSSDIIGRAIDYLAGMTWSLLVASLPVLAAVVGFAAFGLIVSGSLEIGWAGTLFFIVIVVILIWLVRKQFFGDFEGKDAEQQYWGAIIAIGFIGFLFAPYLLPVLLQLGAWLNADMSWLLLPGDASQQVPNAEAVDAVNNAQHAASDLGSRVENLLQMLVPAAATAAGVTVAVKVVGPPLAGLLDYVGLSRAQVAAGRRLRQPVANALTDEGRLSRLYKVQVNLTPNSAPHELPHLRDSVNNRAIIRILLPSDPNLDLRIFEFEKMRELLADAGVSLTNSLFFIYGSAGIGSAQPICYGTGLELFEILAPAGSDACGRLRGRFSEPFTLALKRGDAPLVATLAEAAREAILRQSPQDDALLATYSLADGEETAKVMREMTSRGLRRMLITSRRAPIERAVVSAAELSAFLLSPPDDA